MLADAADREIAVTDFTRNLVVVAGAGTGKTSLLVERILMAVLARGEPLGEIAAITFTEKAASELRIRLAGELEALRHLLTGSGRSAAGGFAARAALARLRSVGAEPALLLERVHWTLDQIDAASIGTIHSFCAELLRRYPRQARVVPNFKIDDGLFEDELVQELSSAWLEQELGPGAQRPQLWERVLDRFAVEELLKVAQALVRARIPEAALAPELLTADPRAVLGLALSHCRAEIERALSSGSGFNPSMPDFLASELELIDTLLDSGVEEFKKRAAGALPHPRFWDCSVPAAGAKLTGIEGEPLKRLASRTRKLLQRVRSTELAVLADLVELAAPLVLQVRETALQRGWVSFDALLALTRDLLRDHPAVRGALQRCYRRLLIDEFQDTDPLQYEIVLFLAQDPEDRRDLRDAYQLRLAPGKLFIVGDPKQSIYRFRGADVGAYQRAIEAILPPGAEPLHLVTNFRAPARVLEPLHRVFCGAFQPQAGVQPAYQQIVADPDHQPSAGAGIELISVPVVEEAGADRERRRREEGEAIALLIEQLVAGSGEPSPVRYRDIAILFRATSDVALYLRALHERDLPFVAEGGRTFYARPEVMDFLGLLRALANPNDGMAILTVLRSPLGGVPDAQLARYGAAGGHWSYQAWPAPGRAPEPEVAPDIARTFELLRDLRRRALELPPDALAQILLEETPLLALHAAAFEGAQRVANLLLLAERAAQLGRTRMRTLEQLIAALGRESAYGSQQGDSPLADETVDAVRVLTIHKAKGLEFPIVIVPDLGRLGWKNDEREPLSAKLVPGDRLALRCGELRTPAELLRQFTEQEHEEAESIRLFYVACTRAQERLYLVQSNPEGAKGWLALLEPWGFPSSTGAHPDGPLPAEPRVVHRTLAPASSPPRSALIEPIDLRAAVTLWNESVARTRQLDRDWRASPSGLREEAEELAEQHDAEPLRHAGSAGRALGLAAHALLETLDTADPDAAAGRLPVIAQRAAASTGADAQQVERELRALWNRVQRSPLLERLRSFTLLGRELPVLAPLEDGRLLRGYVDLLARDQDGELVVVDYKTDHASAASAESVAQRYRLQLQAYARSLQQALKLSQPPRCEIWLLRAGTCVPLDPVPPAGRPEVQLDLFS